MPYFVVRIEHPSPGKTLFNVEPSDSPPGLISSFFDSTPAYICIVESEDPSLACRAAWLLGKAEIESVSPGSPVLTPDDLFRILPPPNPRGLAESLGRINEALGTSYAESDLAGSSWECPDPDPDGLDGYRANPSSPVSPTGRCVYWVSGTGFDSCLFCGLPEERK